LNYSLIEKLLELTAKEYNCEKLCVCCYDNLLENIFNYDRYTCDFNYTVKNIAEKYPKDKLIIRVNEHLTCSIYGTVLDIWDCSDELVDCYWIVK
jgi:hypothetical protein